MLLNDFIKKMYPLSIFYIDTVFFWLNKQIRNKEIHVDMTINKHYCLFILMFWDYNTIISENPTVVQCGSAKFLNFSKVIYKGG